MSALTDRISGAAKPLTGSPNDYDSLIEMVGEARFVLLGEASHGTHEFYRERALITKRLIYQRGFNAVAVEADWPDAYRINRFVRGEGHEVESVDALSGFKRFPQWMWRNADVLDFVGWLREHNDNETFPNRKAGFYGLDLYSLHASIGAVSPISEKLIRRRRSERGIITVASSTSGKRSRPTAMPPASASRPPAKRPS